MTRDFLTVQMWQQDFKTAIQPKQRLRKKIIASQSILWCQCYLASDVMLLMYYTFLFVCNHQPFFLSTLTFLWHAVNILLVSPWSLSTLTFQAAWLHRNICTPSDFLMQLQMYLEAHIIFLTYEKKVKTFSHQLDLIVFISNSIMLSVAHL